MHLWSQENFKRPTSKLTFTTIFLEIHKFMGFFFVYCIFIFYPRGNDFICCDLVYPLDLRSYPFQDGGGDGNHPKRHSARVVVGPIYPLCF